MTKTSLDNNGIIISIISIFFLKHFYQYLTEKLMSIYLQCSLKLHKLLKLQCLPRNGQNVVRFEFFCSSTPYRCENKNNRWACPPLAMMYHAVQSLKIEMDFFKQYYVKNLYIPRKSQ